MVSQRGNKQEQARIAARLFRYRRRIRDAETTSELEMLRKENANMRRSTPDTELYDQIRKLTAENEELKSQVFILQKLMETNAIHLLPEFVTPSPHEGMEGMEGMETIESSPNSVPASIHEEQTTSDDVDSFFKFGIYDKELCDPQLTFYSPTVV
jgi:hypothetical protein